MENSQKMYSAMILLMGVLMLALNHCTKIFQCALVFSSIIFLANVIAKHFSLRKSIVAIATYVIINILFLQNYNYTINGQAFNYLVPVSLLSVMFSSIVSIVITFYITNKLSLPINIFIAMISATIIDGIFISLYYLAFLPLSKIVGIMIQESLYKAIYAFIFFILTKVFTQARRKYLLATI